MKLLSRQILRRKDPVYNFFDDYSKRYGSAIKFLQIGANDGLRNDPIREHILRNQWDGVLVEPIPGIFEILVNNYNKLPELEFVNAAISSSHCIYQKRQAEGDNQGVGRFTGTKFCGYQHIDHQPQ